MTKTIPGRSHDEGIAGDARYRAGAERPGTGDVIAAALAGLAAFALLRWHGDKPLPSFLIALASGVAVGVRRHRIGVFVLLIGLFYWLGWLG